MFLEKRFRRSFFCEKMLLRHVEEIAVDTQKYDDEVPQHRVQINYLQKSEAFSENFGCWGSTFQFRGQLAPFKIPSHMLSRQSD